MSETGIAPIRRDEDEKICGDDGGAAPCPDAGIGKQRHGVRFRTVPLMKRPAILHGWLVSFMRAQKG